MIMLMMIYLYWEELYDDNFSTINYVCINIFRNSIVYNLFNKIFVAVLY